MIQRVHRRSQPARTSECREHFEEIVRQGNDNGSSAVNAGAGRAAHSSGAGMVRLNHGSNAVVVKVSPSTKAGIAASGELRLVAQAHSRRGLSSQLGEDGSGRNDDAPNDLPAGQHGELLEGISPTVRKHTTSGRSICASSALATQVSFQIDTEREAYHTAWGAVAPERIPIDLGRS